jgi:hypothetical protein
MGGSPPEGSLERSYKGAQICAPFEHFSRCVAADKPDMVFCMYSFHKAVQICAALSFVHGRVPARRLLSLDFSNSISLWRRMKPATAVSSGNRGKFDRVGALWFEARGLRVRRRAASRNASPGGRAPSLGAAERYLVFARVRGSGGVEGPPQIQISHFEFDLVRAA